MPVPFIFTFYSYKGGVGRSLALMNVAYKLAGWGRHVLIVDMDLEAPGISGFLLRSGELGARKDAHSNDVLTLLDEAIRPLFAGGEIGEMAQRLPPVSNYLMPVALEKLTPLAPRLGDVGRLDIVGTDQTRNYLERLAQLGLNSLTPDQLADLGSLLHYYFKKQTFAHRPLGVEPFESPQSTPYD
jgi:hypothetical protein